MKVNKEALVCFSLESRRFALPVASVERVIRAVAITPIKGSTPFIYGVMDLIGEIIPVVNLRARFGLPEKELSVDDRFIITKMGDQHIAVVVDLTEEVRWFQGYEILESEISVGEHTDEPHTEPAAEIIRFLSDDSGIIVIYDIAKLLGREGGLLISKLLEGIKGIDYEE